MQRLRENATSVLAVLLLVAIAVGTWLMMRGSSEQARLCEVASNQASLRMQIEAVMDLVGTESTVSSDRLEELERQSTALQSRLDQLTDECLLLRTELAVCCIGDDLTGIRICTISLQEAMDLVCHALEALETAVKERETDLANLFEARTQGGMTSLAFDLAVLRDRIEVLLARADLTVGLINQMEASASFADLDEEIVLVKREGTALTSSVRELLDMLSVSTIAAAEKQAKYALLESSYRDLTARTTKLLKARMLDVAVEEARNLGVDFLIYEDGIVSINSPGANEEIIDLNELLREQLQSLL